MVKLAEIDPESSVNVRKTGVAENVKEIWKSIKEHGYLPEFPVVLRPHPKKDSPYKYENVSGQCRTEASRELGREDIPAIIVELSDDKAKKRSFMENVNRSELPVKDSINCVEPKWKEFRKQRRTKTEAIRDTAEFWGISDGKVRQIIVLADASDKIMDMVDRDENPLPMDAAIDIVKSSYDPSNSEQSEKVMNERADWFVGKERDDRKSAREAIKKVGTKASVDEVQVKFEETKNQKPISFAVPVEAIERLIEHGKKEGIDGATATAKHIVMKTIR